MSFGLQTSVASILFYKKKSMKKFTTMLACCFFAVSIFAQIEMIKPEGLKMGDTAPDINAMDQDGKKDSIYFALIQVQKSQHGLEIRKSTRLNSSHGKLSRMPSSA